MVGDYMFHRDPTKEKKVQYSIRKLFSILELKRTALTGQLTTTGRLTTHAREWNTICFCWSVEQQQAFKVLGSRDGYEEGTNNARILVEGWVATWRESWTSAEFHLFHFFFFQTRSMNFHVRVHPITSSVLICFFIYLNAIEMRKLRCAQLIQWSSGAKPLFVRNAVTVAHICI